MPIPIHGCHLQRQPPWSHLLIPAVRLPRDGQASRAFLTLLHLKLQPRELLDIFREFLD